MNKGGRPVTMPTTQELLAAIHAHCLQCSGGSRKEVQRCGIKDCRLYPYRMPNAKPAKEAEPNREQISIVDLLDTKAG